MVARWQSPPPASLGSSANPLTLSNNTATATLQGIGSSTISIGNPLTLAGGGAARREMAEAPH